jgi:hypothetical protein
MSLDNRSQAFASDCPSVNHTLFHNHHISCHTQDKQCLSHFQPLPSQHRLSRHNFYQPPLLHQILPVIRSPHCTKHMPLPKKRRRELSTSPKIHRVKWTEKRTRRGTVLAAKLVSPSIKTPVKSIDQPLQEYTNSLVDRRPPLSKGIIAAMSLPPIPAPEHIASTKQRRGKV